MSGHGVDQAGCGAPATAPCRSLQYAHDNAVNAGGEIDILDPAGYGAITITKSVSIVNEGVGTAGVQASSGDAISINAGSNDAIYLRGLNVDGLSYAGAHGVNVTSARYVMIDHCVVRHFNSIGIAVQPAASGIDFVLRDTTIADNLSQGLYIAPSASNASVRATADRIAVLGSGLEGVMADGAGTTGAVTLSLSNSLVSHNSSGVLAQSNRANTVIDADNDEINQNGSGLVVVSLASAHLSRSALNQNDVFGANNETSGGGVFYSTGDNHFEGNGTGAIGGANPTLEPLH